MPCYYIRTPRNAIKGTEEVLGYQRIRVDSCSLELCHLWDEPVPTVTYRGVGWREDGSMDFLNGWWIDIWEDFKNGWISWVSQNVWEALCHETYVTSGSN